MDKKFKISFNKGSNKVPYVYLGYSRCKLINFFFFSSLL